MKKLFQLFKIQPSARVKKSISKRTSADKRTEIKTDTKAYLTMPMTFDFTAYFDDNELDNNTEDIPREKQTIDTKTEVFCMNEEKCNEMRYPSNIKQFECCIN